jgi:hypothetical protein
MATMREVARASFREGPDGEGELEGDAEESGDEERGADRGKGARA